MKLFEKIPEGFNLVNNEESYQLTLLTLALAFGDNHYPIPSIPTEHNVSVKTWHNFCKPVFDYSLKNGIVITNEDYTACMCLTEMGHTAEIDTNALYEQSKKFMSDECAQNQKAILDRMAEIEAEFKYKPGDVFVELFAVVTQMQRKKLGSKLMRTLFEECDKQGKDIFLVTSTERNYDMYKHFGFEAIKRDYVKNLHALTYLLVRRHK